MPIRGPVYGNNIPVSAPLKRVIDIRALTYALSGQEMPYPVYQFSGYRQRYEWPKHNPFLHTPPFY